MKLSEGELFSIFHFRVYTLDSPYNNIQNEDCRKGM